MKNKLSVKVLLTVLIILLTTAGAGMVMASQNDSPEKDEMQQVLQTDTFAEESEEAGISGLPAHGILYSKDTVPEGVYVNDMDLSCMTFEEADAAVRAYIDEKCAGTLTLTLGDKKTEIPFSDFDFEADPGSISEEIRSIGKSGNLLQKYKALADAKYNKKQFIINFEYDSDLLRDTVARESGVYNTEMSNASLVRHSGEFIITDETVGMEVDAPETVNAVFKAMEEDISYDSISVPITAKETKPQHTRAELEKVTDLLGGYSTEYWGSTEGRIANIANGASLIDETVLYPGEIFSTLAHVQPFTYQNGYYEATGYSGGKVVPSIGGGICQVSTTLYNAVLRAELEVVERYNHGLTVAYVPLAADATVSEDECDFRFKNILNDPVYIEAYTYDGSVYVNIYGKEYRAAGRTVEFDSVTEYSEEPGEDIIVEDPTLPEGYMEVTQSAHTGYVASLYKYIYFNGSLADTQLVNTSEYYSAPAYITVGTGRSSESETNNEDDEGAPPENSEAAGSSEAEGNESDDGGGELEDADY